MTGEIPTAFDDLLERLSELGSGDEDAVRAIGGAWRDYGPLCRDLLRRYVEGGDLSERTERVLFSISHLLAGYRETASFPDFCRLAMDRDRLYSVLPEEVVFISYPRMLISTYGGDPAALFALIEHPEADESARCDALLVLAYLTRTGQITERVTYSYLAGLPARLEPGKASSHWTGFGMAVAVLGFAGLAGVVEGAFKKGLIDDLTLSPDEFWDTLKGAQQNPNDLTTPIWDGLEPIGNPVDYLLSLENLTLGPENDDGAGSTPGYQTAAEPLRNPLRDVGRNDSCPCGSGKKFKKCCLHSAGA